MNFKKIADLYATAEWMSGGDSFTGSEPHKADDFPINRSTKPQAPVETDALDPATPGGPAPYNGVEPRGLPVVSDPLLATPPMPGAKVPSTGTGPDVDTDTFMRYRQGR